MAYKKIEYGISFADIAIQAYSDKNRNLLFLREVESTINWRPVQALLLEHYEPGKSKTGEQAYPPLLLFKCKTFARHLNFCMVSQPHHLALPKLYFDRQNLLYVIEFIALF